MAIVDEEFGKDPASLNSPEETYQQAKKLYAQRDPADTMLEPAPFNNTYGIFVRKEVAEETRHPEPERPGRGLPGP